jgi:hypothetical protein
MEYSKFSVKELKSILDKKGFKGYSKYRKDELVNLLSQMEDIEEEERIEEELQKEEENKNEITDSSESSSKESEEPKDETKEPKDETTEEEKEIIQNTIQEIMDDEEISKEQGNQEEISEEQKIEIPPLPSKIEEVKKKEGLISSSNPVNFLEHVRTGIGNLTSEKKSDILKSIVEFKTVQKMQEHQRLQDEFDKLHTRCNFLKEEINYLKNYTKEVRESFLMAMMIIMHNFSFLPLEKLPIFKKK